MQNLIPLANPLENLPRIEYNGQPVLTYEQLAAVLSSKGDRFVTVDSLKMNFRNNRDRFVEGKHFIELEGDDLSGFKDLVKNFYQVPKNTPRLYLFTKRGVARHCKSVGTDVAWDVYEALEDTYFATEVDRDKPLQPLTDFQRGKALSKLAQAAQDPNTKKRLVAKAANLILGEEFIPVPDFQPVVQVSLFTGIDSSR